MTRRRDEGPQPDRVAPTVVKTPADGADSTPPPALTAPHLAKLDSLPTIAGYETFADRLPEGTVFAGRYRIGGLLGFGGMGAVYRAHDELLDLDVALKVLRREIAADESFLQRFRHELLVARKVTHRHVVRIHDLGEHEGQPFMTMDLIPGRSLREVMLSSPDGRVDVETTLRIVRQVAEALAEAHRMGVVHRDLKPANILVDEAGDAYVTDFGVARWMHAPGLTRTGEVLGTPDYLAPEQARGEKVDGRTDIYALGLIWFEMLSGERPFAGGSLLEVLAQHMSGRTRTLTDIGVRVPAPINDLIAKCLAREVKDRYPDAGELIADIDDLGRPGRRRWLKRLEAAAAAALLVLALVLLWQKLPGLWRPGRGGEEAPRPHAVAILPFVAEGGAAELAWTTGGVPALLAGALQESPAVRVVDTARVEQTLRDLGFDPATLDASALDQLAKLLQVDRLVTGRVRTAGDRVQLVLRLSQPGPSGALVARDLPPVVGGASDIFAMTESLGGALRGQLELPAPAQPAKAQTSSAEAMRAYSEGLGLAARGDDAGAAAALEQATSSDPGFAAAWVQLSRAYEQLGRPDEALQAAERAAAAAGPGSGRVALEARARQALLRDEPKEAQRALTALVERYPNDLDARVRLAEAYGAQGNFREAMAALEQVVARDEKDARAWYLLGRYAIENGDAQKAADDYLVRALLLQTRLENRAGQAEVTNALGLAYQLLGQLDDAVKRFREAAEQRRALGDRDGLAVAQKNLGNALLAKGDVGGAERALADALTVQQELQPARVAELETAYGALEEERGRYPAALERYKRALKLRQDLGDEAALAESRDDVGYTYYLLGDYDNARFNLDAALALFEKHGNPGGALLVRQGQGACQLAQGQWREAIETFHDSLERSKKLDMDDARAVAHGSLARLAYLEGRYGAALASYVEASKLVERLGDRRGQAEYALGEAETLLAIESLPAAAERLAKVDGWRREGLSREQQALLTLLQGRLRARRGERPAARQAFAAAAQAAAAISSVPLELEARLGAALAEPTPPAAELRKVLAQAQALGHAALELEAAEALARAELAAGRARPAEELLRAALQRQRRVGSWRRGFALHQLLAAAYRKRGATAEAASELAAAQAEAKRVIESVPKEQRGAFFSLAELRELTSSG